VRNDAEWAALGRALDQPAWVHDARFANSFRRWQHATLVDRHMAETTQPYEATALAARLCTAGIPAGVVQTNRDLLGDLHLHTREAFWVMAHRLAGTHPYPAPSTRLTGTPPRLKRPAPNLGEHNTDLLTRLLGLSPAQIDDLETQGVIGNAVR
jgi:crotonobetainyl-CoA:carnitine CoA-transferase CaiB-like acyl-CoA transferase